MRVRRPTWPWVGAGLVLVAILAIGTLTLPRALERDPCDAALPFATELGLRLSDADQVVSCEWHSNFPDHAAHAGQPESRRSGYSVVDSITDHQRALALAGDVADATEVAAADKSGGSTDMIDLGH